MIEHIWACTCRTETVCRPEDQALGAVFQCPGCHTVWGCVRPKGGGKAWIRIADRDVEFHHLIAEPVEEDA